ncbi:MAG: DUF393 domain-containing protein [Bacteroidetes bacterium]|nr:DUF393 domain-containing protein [Bacteroidota bacterium]
MKEESVILFDGVCNLCNNAVDFVIRRDRKGVFRYGALQSEAAIKLLAQHPLPANLDSIVLIQDQRIFIRSGAAIRIARHLGSGWPLLTVFLLVPAPVRDAVYDWIARNRYRWFGRKDSCRLPTLEEQALFL